MNTDVQIGPECPHKGCGQVFNDTNIRLAIYLNGIFFLLKPEKGIIGFTCPKCQKTITNSASHNDILKIKDQLANYFIDVVVHKQNENGESILIPKSSFVPDLQYHSPFMLKNEIIDELSIGYFTSNHMDDVSTSDQILNYIDEERPELKDWYCSFVGDSNKPIYTFRTVCWFDEKIINACLQYENDHGIRIFPRYHYHTELMESVNSLLGYNYFMGKTFDQAKADHEKKNSEALEAIKAYARKTNQNFENIIEESGVNSTAILIQIIEQNQERIANDPVIPGKFLRMLTSKPAPLGNLLTEGVCDYLWSEVKPFERRDFPGFFISEIDDLDLKILTHQKLKNHLKMVDLVQENYTKQYVQEFLKDNLVDFLGKYEDLTRSNSFSYADIWRLKESYLVRLYKSTLKGVSDEAPYVMKRDGEDWKIIYNGDSRGLLKGIGFGYIYHLLENENEEYYHSELLAVSGTQPATQTDGDKVEYNDAPGQLHGEPMTSKEGLKKIIKSIKDYQKEIDDCRKVRDEKEINSLIKKKDFMYKELLRVYDPKTKRIRYRQNVDKKKAADSVGNAIKRALTSLAKKHPEAHQHLFKALDGKHIYRDTLSYRPAPDDRVDWILA